jgi:hypothetical protein
MRPHLRAFLRVPAPNFEKRDAIRPEVSDDLLNSSQFLETLRGTGSTLHWHRENSPIRCSLFRWLLGAKPTSLDWPERSLLTASVEKSFFAKEQNFLEALIS